MVNCLRCNQRQTRVEAKIKFMVFDLGFLGFGSMSAIY